MLAFQWMQGVNVLDDSGWKSKERTDQHITTCKDAHQSCTEYGVVVVGWGCNDNWDGWEDVDRGSNIRRVARGHLLPISRVSR